MARDNKKYQRNKGNPKFSQRYTRKRYEDPEFDNRVRKNYFEDMGTDGYWNPWNPDDPDEDYYTSYNDDGKYQHLMDGLYMKLLKIKHTPFNVLRENEKEYKPRVRRIVVKKPIQPEEKISRFDGRVNNYEDIDFTVDQLKDYILHFQSQEFIISEMDKNPILVKNLLFFSPFWIRSTSSWNLNSELSLIEHIFGFYKIPEFLNNIWFSERFSYNTNFFYISLVLMQGGSLFKLATLFQWNIKKNFAHYLYKIESDMKLESAFLLAEILRRGGSKSEFEILKKLFHTDRLLFSHYNDSSDTSFRSLALDWFINYGKDLSEAESNLIMNWAEHERIEADRNELQPFSWKGRKPKRTLERAEEYHQLIIDSRNGKLFWEKKDFDWDYVNDKSEKWQFIELTSSQELHEEGYQLHHCVASYDFNCSRGLTAIVSLRVGDKSKLTIEIDLNTNQIRQVRGSYNRSPKKEEKAVISAWIKEKILR